MHGEKKYEEEKRETQQNNPNQKVKLEFTVDRNKNAAKTILAKDSNSKVQKPDVKFFLINFQN